MDDPTAVDDESSRQSTPAKQKRTVVRGTRAFLERQSESFGPLAPETLHEYAWPPGQTKERWMLQEQLMEYVQVSSFKRKYPDLARRPVDAEERAMLINLAVISETLAELGLTAIPSAHVRDLLQTDFPREFDLFQRAQLERQKHAAAAKHREMDAVSGCAQHRILFRSRTTRASWRSCAPSA